MKGLSAPSSGQEGSRYLDCRGDRVNRKAKGTVHTISKPIEDCSTESETEQFVKMQFGGRVFQIIYRGMCSSSYETEKTLERQGSDKLEDKQEKRGFV